MAKKFADTFYLLAQIGYVDDNWKSLLAQIGYIMRFSYLVEVGTSSIFCWRMLRLPTDISGHYVSEKKRLRHTGLRKMPQNIWTSAQTGSR